MRTNGYFDPRADFVDRYILDADRARGSNPFPSYVSRIGLRNNTDIINYADIASSLKILTHQEEDKKREFNGSGYVGYNTCRRNVWSCSGQVFR